MQNVSNSKGGSMSNGLYVTIEGLDGAGKSKHTPAIVEYFKKNDHDVVAVREPGGTEGAELARECIFGEYKPEEGWDPRAEFGLYNVARAQLMNNKVIPAIKAGKTVISDRDSFATVCYQGFGRQQDPDLLHQMNMYFTQGVMRDVMIILHADFDTMMERAGEGSTPTNDIEVYRRAWRAYEQAQNSKFAKRFNLGKVIMVDTEQSFEKAKKSLQVQLDELLVTA